MGTERYNDYMFKKVLSSLIFILVGIIIAEVVFFYFPTKKTTSLEPDPTEIMTPSPSPLALNQDQQAFNAESLRQLKDYYGSEQFKSELKIEDEGVIEEIKPAGKTISGWEYEKGLLARIGPGPESIVALAFNKKQSNILQTVKMENGKEVPISWTDLKKGDRIRWISTMDLSKEWDDTVVSFKIIK